MVNGALARAKPLIPLIPPNGEIAGIVYAATAQDVDDAVRGGGRGSDIRVARHMRPTNVLCCSIDLPNLIDKERDLLVELQTQDNGKTLEEVIYTCRARWEVPLFAPAVCETLDPQSFRPRRLFRCTKTYEPMVS